MAETLAIMMTGNHYSNARKIEARTFNQIGSAVSMVSSPGPPLSGGTTVYKFTQNKDYSYLFSDLFTPTADKYIHFGFYFRFGLQIIPATTAGYVRFILALASDNSSHWTIRLNRVDESNHEFALWDANLDTELDVYANPVAIDTDYRGEVIWENSHSGSLRFRIWEVSGDTLINETTIFDISGEDFLSQSGSDVTLAHVGQGDNPLTYPTEVYTSQSYAIHGVDGLHRAFPGHIVKTYRPEKASATPDYDGITGVAGAGDDLETSWDDAGDGSAFSTAEYTEGGNGCIDLPGPAGDIGTGARIIGAHWMSQLGGRFGQTNQIIAAVWGKAPWASSDAIVSQFTTSITVAGFYRTLQSFNATSSHRVPDTNSYLVLGLSHIGASASDECHLKEGWGQLLIQYPIPASFVSVDGPVAATNEANLDRGRRVVAG